MARRAKELPAAVTAFLDTDERIERCPTDRAYAVSVLDSVADQECEDMLHAASQDRWTKANTYSYDAARKAVESWLLAHGWRIRPVAGAHAAAVEVVDRWLGDGPDPGPRIARSFGASRKARHDDEYPSPQAPHRTKRELRALVFDNIRLVSEIRRQMGLEALDDALPTEDVLARRR
jgi:hypothetical protein